VSETIRDALLSGRNTANKNRQASKERLIRQISFDHSAIIARVDLSCSAVATRLAAKGHRYGISIRTLRQHIALIRKVGRANW
jgi:hypothetical protein